MVAIRGKIHLQILLGLAGGVALGALLHTWVPPATPGAPAATPAWLDWVRLPGQAFILALTMLIAPLILASLCLGVASLDSLTRLGRVGAKTFVYYFASMGLAVANGLVWVNLFQPGRGADLGQAFLTDAAKRAVAEPKTAAAFVSNLVGSVLANPFRALAELNVLGIVAFAVLLGCALLAIGERGRPVLAFLDGVNEATTWLVGKVMLLAPVGVLFLLAHVIAGQGLDVLSNLARYVATVLVGLVTHTALVLMPLVVIFGRISPLRFWIGMRDALAVALGTSSSNATLPVSLRCVQENLGVSPRIASFVLPLGATVNMNGTALYEAVAALFIAQAYGIQLGLEAQALVAVTAVAAAVGAAGIPSAGLVTMVLVLSAVGLPLEGIGLILSVDRVLDMCRTTVNVADDAVGALIVGRLEGEIAPSPADR